MVLDLIQGSRMNFGQLSQPINKQLKCFRNFTMIPIIGVSFTSNKSSLFIWRLWRWESLLVWAVCCHYLSGWEHKVDVIGRLIEVKSLSCFSLPIVPDPSDLSTGWLVSEGSGERCQVSVATSQSTGQRIERYREEEEMRGDMEWLWQVS